jgi:hypothetical protein
MMFLGDKEESKEGRNESFAVYDFESLEMIQIHFKRRESC